MSTASKVAMASAAGVLAATAVGLATTEKGRKLTRQVEQKITPMMRQRWSGVLTAVEASLAEHGLLRAIPARVREAVVQRLCTFHAGDNTSSTRGTTSARNGRGAGSMAAARRRPAMRPVGR
jgi:hypothetical protein